MNLFSNIKKPYLHWHNNCKWGCNVFIQLWIWEESIIIISQTAFAWVSKVGRYIAASGSSFMQSLCTCSDKLAKKFACLSFECNDIPKRAMFAEYVRACYKCALYEALGAITVSAVSASFIVLAPNLWVSASSTVGIFLASSVYKRLNNPTHIHSALPNSFLSAALRMD